VVPDRSDSAAQVGEVMKYRATYEALNRISPEVLELLKARFGAFYREHAGKALLQAGHTQMVEFSEFK
jgi:hypothetical protein